jgi:pyruvate,water dikinase
VAVRSSAREEDAASVSFAGQFASVLNVEGPEATLEAVEECWASYLSDRSLAYRAAAGMPLDPEPTLAVVVQLQVFAEKAGVLFTAHPLDPDAGAALIEASFGTGESVVGGLATPDSVTVDRRSGEVVERVVGSKRQMTTASREAPGTALVPTDADRRSSPALTDAEARAVVEAGLRVEELLGGPQDVEWAIEDGRLWILQARPVTGQG